MDGQLTERVKVAEAAEEARSVFNIGDSAAADEFTAVCSEILDRLDLEA